jgi:hypothetical protein
MASKLEAITRIRPSEREYLLPRATSKQPLAGDQTTEIIARRLGSGLTTNDLDTWVLGVIEALEQLFGADWFAHSQELARERRRAALEERIRESEQRHNEALEQLTKLEEEEKEPNRLLGPASNQL